jgi:steroid delta-isomerase-like uncharacterized protein
MKRKLMSCLLAAGLMLSVGPAMAQVDVDRDMVVRFYGEVINKNQLELADKYIAMDAIDHDPMNDPKISTIENFRTIFGAMRKGFPDLELKVEDVIAQGDKVVVRYRMTGTHTGDFMGIKPTNRKVDLQGVDIMRVANGKFVEHWGFMDSMQLMHQLGMMH